MLDWFKQSNNQNTEPVVTPKLRYRVIYTTKERDVGVSTVLIIFTDGREVHTKMYGWVEQYVSSHYDPPMVGAVYGQSSEQAFKQWLLDLTPTEDRKILDDPRADVPVMWVGRVSHAELLKTEPFKVEFKEASVEQYYQ